MDINAAFPSDNLKAADLGGQELPLVISHLTMEKFGDDVRPVVHFQGMQQRLVLNKTNSNTIASMYGPETDHWSGRQITLYPAWTDYQGKQVACIRVKPAGMVAAPPGSLQGTPPPVPQPGVAQQPAASQPPSQPFAGQPVPPAVNTAPPSPGLDDEIPF